MADVAEVFDSWMESNRVLGEAPVVETQLETTPLTTARLRVGIGMVANAGNWLQEQLQGIVDKAGVTAAKSDEAVTILTEMSQGSRSRNAQQAITSARRMGEHATGEVNVAVAINEKTQALGALMKQVLETTKEIDALLAQANSDADNAVAARNQAQTWGEAYMMEITAGRNE